MLSKLIYLFICGLLLFAAGYLTHKTTTPVIPPQVITKTEIQYVDRIVEKVVYVADKSKKDTTITKPDGTVEHTITQNDIRTNEHDIESVKTITKIEEKTVIKAIQNNYSLGVSGVLPKPYIFATIPQLEIIVGYRILGNIWTNLGFNKDSKAISLGINFQF